MPMHDWSKVTPGEFHYFYSSWMNEIRRALNTGLLPANYYAGIEQHVHGFIPDVVTLKAEPTAARRAAVSGVLLREPRQQPTVETGTAPFYRQNRLITVRRGGSDHLVGVIEVVSPGNKSSRDQMKAIVTKATGFLNRGIHLVILDAVAPGRLDPKGLHWAIWEELTGYEVPTPAKPLTMVSYQATDNVRAFVQELSPGDQIDDVPLFLTDGCVELPMQAIYTSAFEVIGFPIQAILDPRP